MKKILLFVLFCTVLANAQEKKEVFYFDVDEYEFSLPAPMQVIAERLKGAEITKIYGYADSTATEAYNLKLSKLRANTVADLVKDMGANIAGAEIKGMGEVVPASSLISMDRRVEVFYIPQQKPQPAEASLSSKISTAQKGDKLKLNVNFGNNSDVVLPSSRPVLNELLKIMQDNPNLKIDIQGHICCQETDITQVSEKRAFAVYIFLIDKGISRSRLSYHSFGSTKPIYPLPEKNEEERIANRRVEVEILSN